MKVWGKIINTSGQIAGTIVEYKVKILGEIVGLIAEAAESEELAHNSRIISKKVGNFIGKVLRQSSSAASNMIYKRYRTISCKKYKHKNKRRKK
ncbi:hypothetical protein RBU49_09315 [Clostridium sp. MB40-C1]|uniref:hypothetical protein n=1 Tax=Clostridium sp. MB40-C1 TaxID=3070996 RepID=UPI0027DFEF07|nr:hypothetical protein [Clostridium sp. MB40-C1]WMJ79091.1 hypothetical protein RBU49_09315 [Clostridium sp. MB40-C1]